MSTHRHSLGSWTAFAAAVLLAACASNPRNADPPPITASTTINGKPWPAGRNHCRSVDTTWRRRIALRGTISAMLYF
jgi:uncharacterized lipoprotein YbaY